MKLYVIVDSTLDSGLKMAQAIHAFEAFGDAHPDVKAEWKPHNNIVVLEHEDLDSLTGVLEALELDLVQFREPDLEDALTALCVEPAGQRHLSTLRLAS